MLVVLTMSAKPLVKVDATGNMLGMSRDDHGK
jgi:hypothetical protein